MAKQQPTTRQYLIDSMAHRGLDVTPELLSRITVEPEWDYSRQDGDTRPESGQPALVLCEDGNGGWRVYDQVYNGTQAHSRLVAHLADRPPHLRIVCAA